MVRRLAVSVAMLLAACGGGGGDGGGGPGDGPGTVTAPAEVAAYCDAYWGAVAERFAACERGTVAWYAGWFDPALRCADPVQAVAAGRARYDRARGGACLGFVAGAACEEVEGLVEGRLAQADCAAAIAGEGEDGDDCWSDAGCASDLCLDEFLTCPSICLTPAGPGESCRSGEPCAAGLYCRMLDDLSYTCQPAAPQGTRCMADADCALGLHCDYGTPAPTCQVRRTSGACGDDSTCAVGFGCVNQACVRRLAAGEACDAAADACGEGLSCGTGGTCAPDPGPGEPCGSVSGEDRDCVGGVCRNGVCEAWAEGATCSTPLGCAPTLTCSNDECVAHCSEP